MRHQRCRTCVRRGGIRRRAGDAATRASGSVVPRGSHMVFANASQRVPTQAESGWLGLESAVSAETANSGRNSKKKNPERTVWLNTNLTSAQFHSKCQNTSPHISSHSLCLCALCLSASLPLFGLPLCLSASVLSPLLHQFILSSTLSHALLTQVSL